MIIPGLVSLAMKLKVSKYSSASRCSCARRNGFSCPLSAWLGISLYTHSLKNKLSSPEQADSFFTKRIYNSWHLRCGVGKLDCPRLLEARGGARSLRHDRWLSTPTGRFKVILRYPTAVLTQFFARSCRLTTKQLSRSRQRLKYPPMTNAECPKSSGRCEIFLHPPSWCSH